jgi:hypothetical protein
MWVRWTVPRFRYDQVMHLGWKVMVPTALAFITLTGTTILILDRLGIPFGFLFGLILTIVNGIASVIFFFLLDRDRVMSGSYEPSRERLLRERRFGDLVHHVPDEAGSRETRTPAGV